MSAEADREAPRRCAALPYRVRGGAVEVLLITRRSGGWIIPKGKIHRKLGPRESARAEALEEAGVEGEAGAEPFDEYRHGGDDGPLVSVFLLRVTREHRTWEQAHERERAWVRTQDAPARVSDPGLARVLADAAVHLAAERLAAPAVAPPPPVPPRPAASTRGGLTPLRVGLAVFGTLGVLALAVWALVARQPGRPDGDARTSLRAGPVPAADPDGRGAPSLGAAAADSACRVQGAPVPLSGEVHEASGIAPGRRAPAVLWTHNDSGEPVVYAFSPLGAPLGAVRVAGARVRDWEDIAAGPCPDGSCLYLADIGDNAASRPSVTVYRVPEPAPTDGQTRPAEAFHATYPDGAQDAEALFVLPDGGVYIVTKGETGPIALYRFPRPLRPGTTARLERVAQLEGAAIRRRERITGASASPDGRWVALRTLDALSLYRADSLVAGVVGSPLRVDLRPLDEAQGEGVGWGPGSTVYLSSEGGRKSNPATLSRLACTPGP